MSDLQTELLKALKELPLTKDYSEKDRYADFRKVFTGSVQGRRVYRELVAWGRLFNTKIPGDSDNMYKIGIQEGNRNFVTKLIAAIEIEPQEKPEKATKIKNIIKPNR